MGTTKYSSQEEFVAEFKEVFARKGNQLVAACGGKEPVMEIEGRSWQLMWNPATGERGYYCYDTDIFHDEDMRDELPTCLRG